MGVYIKGMEMPKDCGECFVGDRTICSSACPLVPAPPHGDLIDRDALMQHIVLLPMDGGHLPIVYASYARNAPTIIPAEEGE